MVLSDVEGFCIDTLHISPDSIIVKLDTLRISLKDNPNSTDWISILSLIIALLAVFIGPLIQRRISKIQIENQNRNFERELQNQNDLANNRFREQIKLLHDEIQAQLNLHNRQDWINLLRNEIAKFIKSITLISSNASGATSQNQQLLDDLIFSSLELKLILRNDEDNQALLLEYIDEAINYASVRDFNALKVLITEKVLPISKKVLLNEWESIQNSTTNLDQNGRNNTDGSC